MPNTGAFHLIYRPAGPEAGDKDQLVDIFQSDESSDVSMRLDAAPGSIAMQLEAVDVEEIPYELAVLGF